MVYYYVLGKPNERIATMQNKQRDTRVHVIRIPLEVSNEIQERAETNDRSVNYIVNKILKAHFEAQKEQVKKG